MADDLFKDCDCGYCGDCGDCCDCDCSCDDCFPDNNVIVICCCFPPASSNNQTNRTNRASTSPDCFPCCCCCGGRSPRRQRRQRRKKQKKKKKGFCCWRLWCCFACNDPSPPPSPPRPGPDELSPRSYYRRDGRYPMDDPDLYMNDRWARHHGLDMPPRGYKSGGRYPMRDEMGMFRDEYYGRGVKWDDPRGMRRDYRRDGRREGNVMPLREDVKKKAEYAKDKPDELVIRPEDYGKDEKYMHQKEESDVAPKYGTASSSEEHPGTVKTNDETGYDTAHQGHQLEGEWSRPVKYEQNATQNKS